eukprot:6140773-Alexandrium_andersonii.AAC.1
MRRPLARIAFALVSKLLRLASTRAGLAELDPRLPDDEMAAAVPCVDGGSHELRSSRACRD